MPAKILFPDLSYQIVGVCFEAHNELGRFAREKQYGDYIEKRFKEIGLPYKRELAISDSGNIIDFLIDEKIILELKCKNISSKSDYFQLQRYLHTSGFELGLLINFRNKYLRPKRILKTNKQIKI